MTVAYRDTALPADVRLDDLLARMTLREKAGQLNQRLAGWQTWSRMPAGLRTEAVLEDEVGRWGGIGAIYGLLRADAWSGRDWATGADPGASAEVAALVQRRVLAGSRLGIPALFVEEAPHGHQALGGHLWPVNLAAASSWRPDLVEEAAAHTALELRARGAHLALVSGLDLLRDPRWGRAEECFGEDPLLAALNLRAVVAGMNHQPGLGTVLKHFAGQGAAIGGRNGSSAPIGRSELAEVHLPAARAAIDAGAVGVMAAYNDIDGVPCVANGWLLTDLLRDEWGFDGIVMADMYAVDRLRCSTASDADAAALAVRAGVDLSMRDVSFGSLATAVENGLLAETVLDRACRRVLAVKLRLGLLDEPPEPPGFPPSPTRSQLVEASPVLLQNRGPLLPLARTPQRVAVIGPNADDVACLLGDYVPPLANGAGTSILAAFRSFGAIEVSHERGCGRTAAIPGGCAHAAELAARADLVVLALGDTSERRYDDAFDTNGAVRPGIVPPVATTGEGVDTADVELPAAQRELVTAVAATGTPVVAIVVTGRPRGIGHVTAACDAVIYAFYPGPDGGAAIAGIVLGDREPVGRLPASLPSGSGVLPVAYNERIEHAAGYVDALAGADHPFGAGLGYTAWELGPTLVRATSLEGAVVSTLLTNRGERRGCQVVQLYGRARVPGRVSRRSVLLGFARVEAGPGESRDVDVAAEPWAIPGLGVPPGSPAEVDVWLSISGATGPPADVTSISLIDPAT